MYTGLTNSLWSGAERKELALTLNGVAVTEALLSMTITADVNGGQALLTIGNTCARTVQLQLAGARSGYLEGVLSLSAQAGGETLPLGVFRVTEAVTRGGQTTVTAVDAMGVALAELYQPSAAASTAWVVLSDLADKAGLTLSDRAKGYQSILSGVSMASLTAGHTGRTVVGWIAGLCGCNALIDRAGALDFCWYSASGVTLHQQDCYEGMDQLQETDSVLSMLSVSVVDANGETRILTPSEATGTGAVVEHPFMTQARLDALWSEIGGMTYRPAELSFLGDLRLDAGDLIALTLEDGTTCSVPLMSVTHTYDGGVTTHVTALGQGESAAAGIRNEGVLGSKLRSLTAEVAQFGALTVEDEDGVTKINGGRIDTDSLFAQDITATGTITGAKLIGAILSGEKIDIQADVAKDSDGAYSTFRLYTDSENDSPTFHIRVKHVQSGYHSDMMQNATDISLSAAVVTLDGDFIEIGADNSDVTLKGTVNMNADVYINDMRPYITAGDTVKISTAYCAGGVTGSTKTLYFYIPMARPIVDVSSVTISNASSAQITARKPAGGYIVQNAAPSSLGTITCKAYENGITVSIKASSAYDATNNTPTTVSVENLQLKFT